MLRLGENIFPPQIKTTTTPTYVNIIVKEFKINFPYFPFVLGKYMQNFLGVFDERIWT